MDGKNDRNHGDVSDIFSAVCSGGFPISLKSIKCSLLCECLPLWERWKFNGNFREKLSNLFVLFRYLFGTLPSELD